jgi:hypothetical protein
LAQAEGLTICWVVARERIDPFFASPPGGQAARPGQAAPADFHPHYRCALLLGSGGMLFWKRFRVAQPAPPRFEDNPLDGHTERLVESLLEPLRMDDPEVVAAYPFTHPRQIVPFAALTWGLGFLGTAPFGVAIDPVHGPWFAWRAAVLTAAEYPESSFPAEAPCAACAAPCTAACPARAVHLTGFRWGDCVDFRSRERPCRERCLAREACPVGPDSRYPREAIRYHYRASLRMIRNAAGDSPPCASEP